MKTLIAVMMLAGGGEMTYLPFGEMSSFRGWIPGWRRLPLSYFLDRLDRVWILDAVKQILYERKHPDSPWLVPASIPIIDSLIKPDDTGIEFGSGRSTLWLAKRLKHLVSIEHNYSWYNKIKVCIPENVSLHLVGESPRDYTEIIDNMPVVDFCLVDGMWRDLCLEKMLPKIKQNGVLVLDNADNYFPKRKLSRSIRYKRDAFKAGGADKERMERVYAKLKNWRCIWTSTAIQDTAIWIKITQEVEK